MLLVGGASARARRGLGGASCPACAYPQVVCWAWVADLKVSAGNGTSWYLGCSCSHSGGCSSDPWRKIKRYCAGRAVLRGYISAARTGRIGHILGLVRRWTRCLNFGCLSKGWTNPLVASLWLWQSSSMQSWFLCDTSLPPPLREWRLGQGGNTKCVWLFPCQGIFWCAWSLKGDLSHRT